MDKEKSVRVLPRRNLTVQDSLSNYLVLLIVETVLWLRTSLKVMIEQRNRLQNVSNVEESS